MARYCEVHAPKLFVSVSVLHNPTGYCLTPGSAHRVLQLAGSTTFISWRTTPTATSRPSTPRA
jgi:DNA-binding transcriptional MocR family regulator